MRELTRRSIQCIVLVVHKLCVWMKVPFRSRLVSRYESWKLSGSRVKAWGYSAEPKILAPLSPDDYDFICNVSGLSREALDLTWVDEIPSFCKVGPLIEWPAANRSILHKIFMTVGSSYVPAVVLEAAKKQDPVTASVDFFERFNTPSGTPCTRAYLSYVCSFLLDMDKAREEHCVHVGCIYEALEMHEKDKAEFLLDNMRLVVKLLNVLSTKPLLAEYRNFLEVVATTLRKEWVDHLEELAGLIKTQAIWEGDEKQYYSIKSQIGTYLTLLNRARGLFSKELLDEIDNIKAIVYSLFMQLEGVEETENTTNDKLIALEEVLQVLSKLADDYFVSDNSVPEIETDSTARLESACDLLGVDLARVNVRTLKYAFRRLAQKCHPDRPEGSNDAFVKINDAYHLIKNHIDRVTS